jgi:hypothetical protein
MDEESAAHTPFLFFADWKGEVMPQVASVASECHSKPSPNIIQATQHIAKSANAAGRAVSRHEWLCPGEMAAGLLPTGGVLAFVYYRDSRLMVSMA